MLWNQPKVPMKIAIWMLFPNWLLEIKIGT